MDIIENLDEIDKLDDGKQWKQLDNWMKQKKLKEYAQKNNQNLEKIINLFHKGEFRKTSQVNYDANTGEIKSLNLKIN